MVNCIYFKDSWKINFDGKLTTEEDFFKANGTTQRCKLMKSATAKYAYYQGTSFTAIQLPYQKRFKAIVMLPNKQGESRSSTKEGLQAIFNELHGKPIAQFVSQFGQREGTIWLPRFKIDYSE